MTTKKSETPKGDDVSNPLAPMANPDPHIGPEGPQGYDGGSHPDPKTGKVTNPDVVQIKPDETLLTGASADVKKGPHVLDEERVRHEREANAEEAQKHATTKHKYKVAHGSVQHGEGQTAHKGDVITLTGAEAAHMLAAGTLEKV